MEGCLGAINYACYLLTRLPGYLFSLHRPGVVFAHQYYHHYLYLTLKLFPYLRHIPALLPCRCRSIRVSKKFPSRSSSHHIQLRLRRRRRP